MPTYDLKNTETGEVKEFIVSISKKEEMIESGEWTQVHTSVNNDSIISHRGEILARNTSSDWRNLLGKIKKGSGRNNTINTY